MNEFMAFLFGGSVGAIWSGWAYYKGCRDQRDRDMKEVEIARILELRSSR